MICSRPSNLRTARWKGIVGSASISLLRKNLPSARAVPKVVSSNRNMANARIVNAWVRLGAGFVHRIFRNSKPDRLHVLEPRHHDVADDHQEEPRGDLRLVNHGPRKLLIRILPSS